MMNTLVATLSFAVATFARPDISLVPSGSYLPGASTQANFLKSGTTFGLNSHGSGNFVRGGHTGGTFFGSNQASGILAPASSDISHIPSGSYLPGVSTHANFLSTATADLSSHGGGYFIGGRHTAASFPGSGPASGSFIVGGPATGSLIGSDLGTGFIGGNIGAENFITGGIGSSGFIAGGDIGTLEIGGGDHKQVHFYAAPEENQERLRIFVAPNSARNTKVIFVKAPSYGALKPEIIAPPSFTEDKTKVYVLVKKPENGGSITIPSTIANKPTKPEVHFIKYQTEQEAEAALASGLQEGAAGPSAPEVGDAQAFVRALKTDGFTGIGGHGGFTGSITGIGGSAGVIGIRDGAGKIGSISSDYSGSHLLGSVSKTHGPVGASGPY